MCSRGEMRAVIGCSVGAHLLNCQAKLSRLQSADTERLSDRSRLASSYQPERLLEELRSLQVSLHLTLVAELIGTMRRL